MIRKPLLALAGALIAIAAFASESVPDISSETLAARQQQDRQGLFVLDVRSPDEFAAGHVPGAVNIPYDQVGSRLAEVPQHKDVVLYCRTGRRAALAAEVLASHGYTRLQHLDGDFVAWVEQGRAVEKP